MLGKDLRVNQLNSIEIFIRFWLNVYRAQLNQTNRSGDIGQGFESQQSNTVVESVQGHGGNAGQGFESQQNDSIVDSVQNHGGNAGQGFESKPDQSSGEEQGYRGDIGQGFESQQGDEYL